MKKILSSIVLLLVIATSIQNVYSSPNIKRFVEDNIHIPEKYNNGTIIILNSELEPIFIKGYIQPYKKSNYKNLNEAEKRALQSYAWSKVEYAHDGYIENIYFPDPYSPNGYSIHNDPLSNIDPFEDFDNIKFTYWGLGDRHKQIKNDLYLSFGDIERTEYIKSSRGNKIKDNDILNPIAYSYFKQGDSVMIKRELLSNRTEVLSIFEMEDIKSEHLRVASLEEVRSSSYIFRANIRNFD